MALVPMKSILLVAQDQTFSARAREALEGSGRFVVCEIASAHGLYEVAQRVQPALMLLEITPETTSALASEILAHSVLQETLIVFLTDDDTPGERWRDARFRQYVWQKKALKIDELVSRVDEILSDLDLLPT
jgi:DNA-binding response OmpR family regulator